MQIPSLGLIRLIQATVGIMVDAPARSPDFGNRADPSISQFAVPRETYLSSRARENSKYQNLATGALVIDKSTPERVLLFQRSAGESMPNLWEIPGGACDETDKSILHGAARELWEEAGLAAASILPLVGDGYSVPRPGSGCASLTSWWMLRQVKMGSSTQESIKTTCGRLRKN